MIEGIPLVDGGATGLLVLVFLLVLTDKLVWHKRLSVLQQRVEAQDVTIGELAKANAELVGSAIPTVNNVLNALAQAADQEESR